MLNLFKKKITSDEILSSLYLLIKKDLVKDDLKDNKGNILITTHKQRLFFLSRFYDFLGKNGLDKVKMRLIAYWVNDNYKINNDIDFTEKTINVLGSVQKINELFEPIQNQEEFTSKWMRTPIFGKEFDLSQKILIMSWCFEYSKSATDILISALRKFEITDKTL